MAPEPDLRILQANERTLLAWIRTGLTLMALGFVLARLTVWLQLEHPERKADVTSWLGIGVVALGTACHFIGATRFLRARRAVIAGESHIPGATGPIAVAVLVAMIGLVAIVYLAVLA
jgi:putative membrane protein